MVDSNGIKSKSLAGFFWRFLEQTGSQGVNFVVSIILARIILPEDYGIIAIANVFIVLLNVFINCGMGSALVQKKDADDLDFSTIFYFNLVTCSLLYLLLFGAAPYIAGFYNMPDLKAVIRVMGLTLVISGVKGVQQSYVSRNLLFKKFFFATLGGTLFAAALGIYMAYAGYGVWALIVQSLVNHFIDTVILWLMVKWRPKLMFSMQRLKILFSYGWKLLISGLLDKGANSLRSLIIGKVYTSADLAQYNKGRSWPSLIVDNVNASIDSVLFPVMSKAQDNPAQVKAITRRSIRTGTYVMAPLLMGLAFIGEPLVRFVLTERWLPSVFFMRIICVTYMFFPIHTANLSAIKALGRSDLTLRLQIGKQVINIITVIATMFISVKAIALGGIVSSVLSQIINAYPNKKLMNYGYLEQLKDIIPNILLAVGIGAVVYCVSFLGLPDLFTLIIQIPLGIVLYIFGSILFRLESFYYVLGTIKQLVFHKL